ncbi:MAG: SpoIIE family protein phosphatase [Lysobacter sp.]|nr:SpoIIE family protein phosphatase [Lysobacter sp.]
MAPEPLRRHSLTLDSSPASAGEASVWVRTLAMESGVPAERAADIDLCVVELVSNVVNHGYRGEPGEIALELALGLDVAVLTVIDSAPAFDPTAVPPPPSPGSLEQATIGGYGIHLVRSAAAACEYERRQGRNVFTAYFGEVASRPRLCDRRSGGVASFPHVCADGTRVDRDRRCGMDRRALGFISRCGMFRDVPWADVEAALSQCRLVEHAAGVTVLQPGPHSASVLVVVEGSLRVHLDGPDSADAFEIPCGGSVGEISVADGKPVSAWVITAEPCKLLVIGERVFLDRLLAIPRVGRNIINELADRTRRSNERIVERMRASAELKALQQELDFARRIQSNMLPAAPLLADCPDIRCHGLMRAARQVGGDFFDAIRQGPQRYFLAIGDVCNKGMPAALFMARALTILRGEAAHYDDDPAAQLARIAQRCNDQLAASNEAQLFVSMLLAIVDTATARLDYCSVGHCAPVLVPPGGRPAFLEGSRNPIAGIVPELAFGAARAAFPAGSRLLLYTDGITEAEATDGRQFGDERMLEVLEQVQEDFASFPGRLLEAIDAFAGGHPQSDDITLLLAGSR